MKSTYLLLGIAIVTLSSFSIYNKVENNSKKNCIPQQQSEGEKLISKMDCIGCHKLDKKLVGPSYLDIAKKYSSNDKNLNYLSDKIIKGGTGVWGSIPMAAHSTLKKEDAKKMAKYILSLNK
ncbi:c-type cytochrome [Flavobacterium sp. MAHUQ-51]|uniref:c-type cytochrome n=1 Tax=Flavobacterium sp. GCM10022190 TaxID=3252639 RepID=UPI00361BC4F5